MAADTPYRGPFAGGATDHTDAWFVGRDAPLASLRDALRDAAAGEPRIALVHGPAGIGKSALLRVLVAGVDSGCVLWASGEDGESSLAFGVFDQLVAEAAAGGATGSGSERFGGGQWTDPFAAGAALVDLLGELQRSGPVVGIIDDAHWADRPSLQALAFALRRLRADRVLVVVAVRDLDDAGLPEGLRRLLASERAIQIRLDGLDDAELREFTDRFGQPQLSARAVARLRAHTGGNPLHSRALLEQVPAAAIADPDVALPAPRSFALLVLARLAACPAEGQRLAAAASVLGTHCPLHQAAAVAGLDDPLTALDQAIEAGLLVEQSGDATVRFPHPLVHAAVYQQLGPARRSELHRRAAEASQDEAVQLRHRSRAATGPNAELAAELARVGRAQAVNHAWANAAGNLNTAARLSPLDADREQLTMEAAECLIVAGDLPDPAGTEQQLRTFAKTGWRSYVLARLAFDAGRLDETETLLFDAWRRCGPDAGADHDPVLGARVASELASLFSANTNGAEAAEWARRALSLAPDRTTTDMLRGVRLVALGMAGQAEAALATVPDLPDPSLASVADLDALIGRGRLRCWIDDFAGARRDLLGVVGSSRSRSVAFRMTAAAYLGEVEYRCGRWDDSVVHCDLALSVAADIDQYFLIFFGHYVGALVPAARGQWSVAEAHVQGAQAFAAGGHTSPVVIAALVTAQLARARNQPAAVVAALEPLARLGLLDALVEPNLVSWRDVLSDALVEMGELDQAETVLMPLEAATRQRRRLSATVAASRARGNLEARRGDPSRAEAAFRTGLDAAGQIDLPFEQALLRLAYGAFLRRTGKRAAAGTQLRAAHDTLARLDARPYLERCDRELAACGHRPGGRRERDTAQLTTSELAVCTLVVTGLTNRQVARELVVSEKTIEYHLRNIFGKLDVTSRTQLAAKLAQA